MAEKNFICRYKKAALEDYDFELIEEIVNPDDFSGDDYDDNAVQGYTVVTEKEDGSFRDYFTGEKVPI